MGPNEDVRDLSGGDCDAPNSDKCVCLLSPTSGNYWVELALLTIARSLNCNLTSPFWGISADVASAFLELLQI